MFLNKKMWFFLLILLVFPIVDGVTFKQFEDMRITYEVRTNDAISSTAVCNITVKDPDQITLVSFQEMTNNLTTQEHEYTVSANQIVKTGDYCHGITCTDVGFNKTVSFCDDVTSTGRVQTSILNNPIIIIFLFFALLLVGLGVWFKSPWFGFIGAVMFLLGGVYTMIYGFNNVTDFYTRGLGVVLLGLGFMFMFAAAYEWWQGQEED